MTYYSLNHQSPHVSFEEATVRGQAPDKGLYFPQYIPSLPTDFIRDIKGYTKEEIGVEVMKPYVKDSLPSETLEEIINETVAFPFPLVNINDRISSLELFHGPTLAFKDVGARFMSRCLGYFNRNKDRVTTVLVATSGDTGGAVANGFLDVDGVEVVILYPSGKVSPVQELQLTTCGQNIKALEVDGTFDDCQAIVKKAFADSDLNEKLSLTSANSINVARWLPQQMYYFFALQQWRSEEPPVVCVPSGNFGNICAGILAHIAGLPVWHFIAALNANDVIYRYLQNGLFEPKPSVATVSNAMDVGNPSNFTRILQIFKHELPILKQSITAATVSDETTKQTIADVYKKYNYILDPHGAVAYKALDDYLSLHAGKGLLLETAHPVKFPSVVEEAIGKPVDIPESAKSLFALEKKSVRMPATYEAVKEWLMNQ